MKIAKKLLAAVVAVMIVCSLAVCAFATTPESAETGAVAMETDWALDASNRISLKIYFVDAVDLKSWDLIINYDDSIFAFPETSSKGTDAKQVINNTDANNFTDAFNPLYDEAVDEISGNKPAKYSGYFDQELWTAEKFLENSGDDEDCVVNSAKFHAATVKVTVIDIDKFNAQTTKFTISAANSTMTFNAAPKAVAAEVAHVVEVETPTDAPVTDAPATDAPATDAPATDAPATDAPATDAPATDAPATDAPATDAPATRPVEDDDDDCKPGKPGHDNCKPNKPACKPGKPNHNHPNTGDSAALAAAAGVVLLAGAAFVVSKKRK